MADDGIEIPDRRSRIVNQRRHPRKTVFKSALVYPVLEEAGLAVENISYTGLSGQCALSLRLQQQVHVSFDEESFRTAEVRWINGSKCGLLTEEPLLWNTGKEVITNPWLQEQQPRDPRLAVKVPAMLVTSAPVLLATVRNISVEGMMIEVGRHVNEGTRLLVKTRGSDVRMGRAQWSSAGMTGIFFESRRKGGDGCQPD